MTRARASSTIAGPMHAFGRAALLLLIAATLVVAGIPPALDEDRSVPGFCSPDCPLQQDLAHSVALAPTPARHDPSGEAAGQRLEAAAPPTHIVAPASPDAPRAPPRA